MRQRRHGPVGAGIPTLGTVVMPLVLRWRRWIRSGGGHGSDSRSIIFLRKYQSGILLCAVDAQRTSPAGADRFSPDGRLLLVEFKHNQQLVPVLRFLEASDSYYTPPGSPPSSSTSLRRPWLRRAARRPVALQPRLRSTRLKARLRIRSRLRVRGRLQRLTPARRFSLPAPRGSPLRLRALRPTRSPATAPARTPASRDPGLSRSMSGWHDRKLSLHYYR